MKIYYVFIVVKKICSWIEIWYLRFQCIISWWMTVQLVMRWDITANCILIDPLWKYTVVDNQRHQKSSFLFGHSPIIWKIQKTIRIALFRTNSNQWIDLHREWHGLPQGFSYLWLSCIIATNFLKISSQRSSKLVKNWLSYDPKLIWAL